MDDKRWRRLYVGWLISALLLSASCTLIADFPPPVDLKADADADVEVPRLCGNRTVEPGEECDDGNETPGDGCENDCRFSCRTTRECDDDNPCTVDRCAEVPGGKACNHRISPGASCDDGDVCTEGDQCDANGICQPGTNICHCPGGTTAECARFEDDNLCNGRLVCNPSTRLCEVDPTTVVACPPNEPCRTFTCEPATGECHAENMALGHPCTPDTIPCTDDICDGHGRCIHPIAAGYCLIDRQCRPNGAGRPGHPCQYCNSAVNQTAWSNRPGGYSCDDGQFCTGIDTCDASGRCVSSGNPCMPDTQVCNEAADRCDPVDTGCVIAGTSYAANQVNPVNKCQWCRPAVSTTAWTNRPDFTPCTVRTTPDYSYDICVQGTCVSPGSCGTADCNAPRPNWTIPDTNQRLCYNNTTTMTCTAFPCNRDGSPDFCGQDAQYGWDTVNPGSARLTRTGTTEPIVTDNVTGLVWQGCSAGQTGPTCTGTAGTYTWVNALAYCDGLTWGGSSNWGLPDPFELQSIVDYRRGAAPYINPTAFPNTASWDYWTSSSSSGSSAHAWVVYFSRGYVSYETKTGSFHVRCVGREP